ncbi:beta-ketoacyl synthase chain length factor [Jejudonia soesokkakensis]|uniref:Beta-ketoacyl synthase chain length factor n=1 Tax=Jejudonia soesokkakensis TaxID=1323432 RepID=A0ABW2MUX0_9FLAO
MKSLYIHSAVAISAQNTFEFSGELSEVNKAIDGKLKAIHPSYRDYIPPAASRRMAPVVKMGVAAATKALQEAEVGMPEAILVGSGLGCMEDTEKFLNSLIDNDEAFMTPTAFIQSTHNTVGAQIALGLGCKNYNNTYVHGNLSFESALLDAQLLIEEGQQGAILVGGVDELGNEFANYLQQLEEEKSDGSTVPIGEGASFFVVSSEKKEGSVELKGMNTIQSVSEAQLIVRLEQFLKQQQLQKKDIDALITGNDGACSDTYFDTAISLLPKATSLKYKPIVGTYFTASAFSCWLGFQLVKKQTLPEAFGSINAGKEFKNVLLYNQSQGAEHSLILISKC